MIKRYNSYKHFLTQHFGGRMQKLTIDAGFSCPNRDGTVGRGGCTYCLNDAFNPSYCVSEKSVTQQLDEGISFHLNRYRRADGYLAYFQAFSNTHAPVSELRRIYAPALAHPAIKGIVIGTRPDCIDEEKLDFLSEINEKCFLSLEFGIESIYDESLRHINRGHTFEQAIAAIEMSAKRNFHIGAHFIFGLPNETPEMWLRDINIINELKINSIKFHQLQIIKGTLMAEEFTSHSERFHNFQNIEHYIDFIVQYTEKLNPNFIIERFAGEVPPRYLLVNHWGNIRYDVILQKIEKELEQRNSWQGKLFSPKKIL